MTSPKLSHHQQQLSPGRADLNQQFPYSQSTGSQRVGSWFLSLYLAHSSAALSSLRYYKLVQQRMPRLLSQVRSPPKSARALRFLENAGRKLSIWFEIQLIDSANSANGGVPFADAKSFVDRAFKGKIPLKALLKLPNVHLKVSRKKGGTFLVSKRKVPSDTQKSFGSPVSTNTPTPVRGTPIQPKWRRFGGGKVHKRVLHTPVDRQVRKPQQPLPTPTPSHSHIRVVSFITPTPRRPVVTLRTNIVHHPFEYDPDSFMTNTPPMGTPTTPSLPSPILVSPKLG